MRVTLNVPVGESRPVLHVANLVADAGFVVTGAADVTLRGPMLPDAGIAVVVIVSTYECPGVAVKGAIRGLVDTLSVPWIAASIDGKLPRQYRDDCGHDMDGEDPPGWRPWERL